MCKINNNTRYELENYNIISAVRCTLESWILDMKSESESDGTCFKSSRLNTVPMCQTQKCPDSFPNTTCQQKLMAFSLFL